MPRTPKFELERDAAKVLRHQWLQPGETLIEYATVRRLPVREGIPSPGWTVEQVFWNIAKFLWLALMWIFVGVVILAIAALADGGGSGGGSSSSSGFDLPSGSKRDPKIVLRGNGSDTMMGRYVTPALRRKGVWVLTDRRVAFLAATGRVSSKLMSGIGRDYDPVAPVAVETVLELPDSRYTYEGERERMRRTKILRRYKPAGVYRRISFPDGSGLDMRKR